MREQTPRFATFALLVLACGLAGIYGLLLHWRQLDAKLPETLGLLLAAGALYVAGVYFVNQFTLGPSALLIVLAGAVAFRALLLPLPPTFSEDTYRYQWEGRVQRLKINPYTVAPASPGLEWVQD